MKPDTVIPHDSLPYGDRPGDERRDYWGALLGFTVSLLRHWKLLVAGPLIVGAAAYVVAPSLQKTYVSAAYIGPLDEATSKLAALVLRSPPVLNVALQKFPQYPAPGMPDENRRLYLADKIKFKTTMDPKFSQLYVLEVEDAEPVRAQQIGTALIDAWLVTTKPPPDKLASLERLTVSNESQLADLSIAITELLKHPELLKPDVETGYAPVNIADMIKLRTEGAKRSEELKAAVAGFSSDLIFAPPTLPDVPAWPIRRELVLRSVGITLVALILFVLMRHTISLASANPVYAPKLKQIGNAMPWRRSSM